MGPRTRRMGWGATLAIAQLWVGDAQAQNADTLSLRAPRLSLVVDSASSAMPASHRSVAENVDRPVRVRYCPDPVYPSALGQYGFGGRVVLQFVVDTMGLAEVGDLVVSGISHPGFVESARRWVGKCRYQPAEVAGRPVRFLVAQPVVFIPSPSRD